VRGRITGASKAYDTRMVSFGRQASSDSSLGSWANGPDCTNATYVAPIAVPVSFKVIGDHSDPLHPFSSIPPVTLYGENEPVSWHLNFKGKTCLKITAPDSSL